MVTPLLALLPGLDGTGELFAPFLQVLPASLDRVVVSYPVDQTCSYADFLSLIESRIGGSRSIILVAESFSGPLALQYAALHPAEVKAVVLCASFIRAPVPPWLVSLGRPLLFRLLIPTPILRLLLVGPTDDPSMVEMVRRVVAQVDPAVFASRIRHVAAVDCADDLRRCTAPILYLRARHDQLVRQQSLREMLSIRPDIAVQTIDGPHLLLQVQPAEAWKAIESFLNSLSLHSM